MKKVFNAIQARIASQVPAVRWVDFDLGQLDDEKPPVSFPCALIGFGAGEYTSIGANATIGQLTVEVSMAFELRERTHSKAAAQFKAEAINHLDTVEAVRIALSGLQGDTFNDMRLSRYSNDRRADLRVYRLVFTCNHYPEPPATPYVNYNDAAGATPPLDFCVHPDIE